MKLLTAAMIVLLCVIPTGARAEQPSVPLQIGMKLTRGAANLTTGWLEMPKQIYRLGRNEGWITGIMRGPIDGVGMSLARMLAGAYEILTFPFPIPPGYQPMLLPDYVWEREPEETTPTP